MAITLPVNISYGGKEPNFARDQFATKAAMLAFSHAALDEGHISYCVEDKTHYKFNGAGWVKLIESAEVEGGLSQVTLPILDIISEAVSVEDSSASPSEFVGVIYDTTSGSFIAGAGYSFPGTGTPTTITKYYKSWTATDKYPAPAVYFSKSNLYLKGNELYGFVDGSLQLVGASSKQSFYNRWVVEKRVLKIDEIVEVGDATINDTDVVKTSSNDKIIWATDKSGVYLQHNGAYYRYWDEYKVLDVTFIFGSDYCNTMTASGCLAVVGGKDLYLIGKLNQSLCLASSDTSGLIVSLQNTINNLIKRIETLEKLNDINNNYVQNGVLYTRASVRDGIMTIRGEVNNGVLKL